MNAAARLSNALTSLKGTPLNQAALAVWPKAFALRDDVSRSELFFLIGEFLELPRLVEQQVLEVARVVDMPHDLLLEWMPPLKDACAQFHPDSSVSEFL